MTRRSGKRKSTEVICIEWGSMMNLTEFKYQKARFYVCGDGKAIFLKKIENARKCARIVAKMSDYGWSSIIDRVTGEGRSRW